MVILNSIVSVRQDRWVFGLSSRQARRDGCSVSAGGVCVCVRFRGLRRCYGAEQRGKRREAPWQLGAGPPAARWSASETGVAQYKPNMKSGRQTQIVIVALAVSMYHYIV